MNASRNAGDRAYKADSVDATLDGPVPPGGVTQRGMNNERSALQVVDLFSYAMNFQTANLIGNLI